MTIDQKSSAREIKPDRIQDPLHRLMAWYEYFEQIVVVMLSLIIRVVIVAALIQLIKDIVPLVLGMALDPLDHIVFQTLFGMIMTLLIAMEFKHSIIEGGTAPRYNYPG